MTHPADPSDMIQLWRPGTPVRRTSPSDTPSNPNTKHRGYIRVRNLADNSVLGYVSSSTFSTGQFGYKDITQALVVNFETDSTGSGTKLDLNAEVGLIPSTAGSSPHPFDFRIRMSQVSASWAWSRVVMTQALTCPRGPTSGSSMVSPPTVWSSLHV